MSILLCAAWRIGAWADGRVFDRQHIVAAGISHISDTKGCAALYAHSYRGIKLQDHVFIGLIACGHGNGLGICASTCSKPTDFMLTACDGFLQATMCYRNTQHNL